MEGGTLAGRYTLLAEAGKGRTGVVYKARDLHTGAIVAVKCPRTREADTLHAIHHEFRVRQEIAHPALVGLRALATDSDMPFLVMEWIEGRPIDRWFAAQQTEAPPALRLVLRQVLDGLRALHDEGVVHGDLKPSHILVEPDGRAVLIDFDLSVAVGHLGMRVGRVGGGTPGYISPERSLFEGPTPMGDVFSLGVIVSELLSSCPEHDDRLLALALAMKTRTPSQRPSIDEARRVLDGSPSPSVPSRRRRFVGRTQELNAVLRGLLDRRWSCHLITGPSGVGKTMLAVTALRKIFEIQPGIVWRSRCHPDAAVPFRALDGWLDGIAEIRLNTARASAAYEALAQTFSWLGRSGTKSSNDDRRAVEAFVDLVQEVAEEAPLRLWLDDAQWMDEDSVPFLEALVQAKPPHVTLVVTSRRNDLPWIAADAQRLELSGIDLEALNEWARQLGRDLSNRTGMRWLEATRGNPMLLSALIDAPADAIPEDPSQIIDARLSALSPKAFDLFARLALCVAPLTRVSIDAMCRGESDRNLQELRHHGLIQEDAWRSELAFSPIHDMLKDVMSHRIESTQARAYHRELAGALAAIAEPIPGHVAHHYREANAPEEGLPWALCAADHAFEAKAWRVAAIWYQTVADWGHVDTDGKVRQGLAEALMASGATGRALEVWTSLRDTPRWPFARLRAAEIAYATGDRTSGDRLLRPQMRALRIWWPPERLKVLAALGWRILTLWRQRFGRRSAATRARRHRLEACWVAGGALMSIDTINGFYFHCRYTADAALVGTPLDQVRARAFELALRATEQSGQSVAGRLMTAMETCLQTADDAEMRAIASWSLGYAQFIRGEVDSAYSYLSRASALWEAEGRGGWERDHAERHVAWSLRFMGRYAQMESYAQKWADLATAGGNRMLYDQLVVGPLFFTDLLGDDVDRADERLSSYGDPSGFPQVLEFALRRGRIEVALYGGDVDRAEYEVNGQAYAMRAIKRSIHRIVEHSLHAALVAALSTNQALQLERAREGARRLQYCAGRWAAAVRHALLAWLAAVEGRTQQAMDLYESSGNQFAQLGMQGHRLACEFHRAELMGTHTQCENVVASIQRLGVKSVHRWLRTLVPGLSLDRTCAKF